MHATGLFVVLAVLICSCAAMEGGALLGSHLSMFIDNNFAGKGLSYTLGDGQTVQDAEQVVGNVLNQFWMIDSGKTHFEKMQRETCQGMHDYLWEVASAEGTKYYSVVWKWGTQSVTTVALVKQGSWEAGNTQVIFESVTSVYTKPAEESPETASSKFLTQATQETFHASFLDGFNNVVAVYDAQVNCVDANPDYCGGSASCIDYRVGMASCQYRQRIDCLGTQCVSFVAFLGYFGSPTITFDSNVYQFQVSDFNAQYYNAFVRLEKPCVCRPPK